MLEFLRTIFHFRKRKITLVLLEDNKPEAPITFNIKPQKLLHYLIYFAILIVFVVTFIFVLTPVGGLIPTRKDEAIRNQVIHLTQEMMALNDSLDIRSQQLNDIIRVIASNKDTTFSVGSINNMKSLEYLEQSQSLIPPPGKSSNGALNADDILYSDIITHKPMFPTAPPVRGNLTRGFEPENGHYGIDIAADNGAYIRAIADGVVINTEWTLNYGYVVYIQHADGYITIYKHCSNLVKHEGDVILKGDILGTVSSSGLMSTGPHVHIEIWHNGIALDPAKYLVLNQ